MNRKLELAASNQSFLSYLNENLSIKNFKKYCTKLDLSV